MAWAQPNYSWNQVDKAGKKLSKSDLSYEDRNESLNIINNWRASHQYPLNTFQITLRTKARKLSSAAIVSQRIKRMESISRKLGSSTMQLSQMQDIGGCRAILPSVTNVNGLVELYNRAEFSHQQKGVRDYIINPKTDGYRSIHLIYRYKGENKTACYDDLQIEIQVRTQLQHAWATAVEAVGTFTKQALKWRGGSADWQRFFLLMSSATAIIENSPLAQNTPILQKDLGREIRHLEQKLRVRAVLRAYGLTMNYIGALKQSKAKLMLVHMRPDDGRVEVRGFKLNESQQANRMYTNMESQLPENTASQIVLVRVDSVQGLQKAYPNFFLDTKLFSDLLDRVTKWA